jgi:capsular polysaccharide biosynthesis protein
MRSEEEIPTVAIGDYVSVVARRWRVVVLGALLGALLGVGYLYVTPPEATATSVVSVAPIISDPYSANRSTSSLVDIQTEAQAAGSMTVAILAASSLGTGVEPADLRSRLTTTPIDATTVMRVSITAPTASQAKAEADAVANAFLGYRSQQASERIQQVLDQDATRLATLKQQLSDANAKLATAKVGTSEYTQAQTDQQLLQAQIQALVQRSGTLEDVDTSGGQVLTSAEVNKVSWSPSMTPILAGGLLAGMVLGLAGAFIRQARDRQVRLGQDIVDAGVGPILARLTGKEATRTERDTEALAVARDRLLASPELRSGSGVLALVEDSSGQAAPDVAADLARSLAEGGASVHVVCVPTADGYREALSRRLDLDRLDADGALSASSHGLLTAWWAKEHSGWSRATRRHLDGRDIPELVLLVCPAGATDADRMAASRLAEAVVVYAVERMSQRASLKMLAEGARVTERPVLGTVVAAHSHSMPEMTDARSRKGSRTALHASDAPWSPVLGSPSVEDGGTGIAAVDADEAPERETSTGGEAQPETSSAPETSTEEEPRGAAPLADLDTDAAEPLRSVDDPAHASSGPGSGTPRA